MTDLSDVVRTVEAHPGKSFSELARLLGSSHQRTNKACKELEAQGVLRITDVGNRSAVFLASRPAGPSKLSGSEDMVVDTSEDLTSLAGPALLLRYEEARAYFRRIQDEMQRRLALPR